MTANSGDRGQDGRARRGLQLQVHPKHRGGHRRDGRLTDDRDADLAAGDGQNVEGHRLWRLQVALAGVAARRRLHARRRQGGRDVTERGERRRRWVEVG